MSHIEINAQGKILSLLTPNLTLSHLLDMIKISYPKLKNEKIYVTHFAKILLDENKSLYELGVSVNIDTLRVLPNKLWKYFSLVK